MSTILVDTLTGKTSAGNITVTSEGGAATMQLQQGLVKTWVNFNGTGTIAARDSFGVSTLADNGTGIYSVGFVSAMSNSDYAMSGVSGGNEGRMLSPKGTYSTTTVQFYSNAFDGSAADNSIICINIHGDLA